MHLKINAYNNLVIEVNFMNYVEENRNQLAKEMAELWFECKVRCDRIEEIVKKINETEEIEF
jgi:hypothetical protein